MRDFLHSEISQFESIANLSSDPDLAVRAGKSLCEDLLEPLQDSFGRIAFRSAYRSAAINDLGHRKGDGCASNLRNVARHIWDENGVFGAMACIVILWFADRYAAGRGLARDGMVDTRSPAFFRDVFLSAPETRGSHSAWYRQWEEDICNPSH